MRYESELNLISSISTREKSYEIVVIIKRKPKYLQAVCHCILCWLVLSRINVVPCCFEVGLGVEEIIFCKFNKFDKAEQLQQIQR